MTYQEIATMIQNTGLSNTYYSFPENSNPQLPYVLFYYPNDNDFKADNTNYQHIRTLNLELYTSNKDFATESTIETMLNANGLVFTKNESYLNGEHMYEVLYQTEVIITEGETPNNGE